MRKPGASPVRPPTMSIQLPSPKPPGTGSTIAVRVKASTADGSESEYVSGEPVEILWHKVVRRMPWALGTPFKARQFTLNPKGQFQTKLENALASATGDPEILPEPVFGDNDPAQIQAGGAGRYIQDPVEYRR